MRRRSRADGDGPRHRLRCSRPKPVTSTSTLPSSSTEPRAFRVSETSTCTANGAPQYVATLDPERGASAGIQVTPDGRWMAFITGSRVTAYDSESVGRDVSLQLGDRIDHLRLLSARWREALSQVEGSIERALPDRRRPRVLLDRRRSGAARCRRRSRRLRVRRRPGPADQLRAQRRHGRPKTSTIGLVSVSADGIDAFFATVDTLVGQDENGPFLKFYDARTNGGFPFTKPPAPCVAADECHGQESAAPAPLTIGTRRRSRLRGNVQPARAKKNGKKRRRCKKGKRCQRKRHVDTSARGGRRG